MGIQIYRDITVDFSNSRYIIINAKQHDSKSRFIRMTCTNVGQKINLNPENYSAFIRYRKSDGYGVFNKCIISTTGEVIFELTEQMLSTVGTSYADLLILDVAKSDINNDLTIISADGRIIENNSSIASTMNFYINVMAKPLDDSDIESTNEFSALNELLLKATADYEYIIRVARECLNNATTSENNAANYANEAKSSANSAMLSANSAANSANSAANSATSASSSANSAKTSATNAASSANSASISATNASGSATSAKISENNAKVSEGNAKISSNNAKTSENKANEYATMARSYAIGDTNTRENETITNSKYLYEQMKQIAQGLNGALLPMGTIKFSQLFSQTKSSGYMYNISDDFISDSTFKDGGGISYPAGTNVYYTADGFWDCLVTPSPIIVGGVVETIETIQNSIKTINDKIAEIEEILDNSIIIS